MVSGIVIFRVKIDFSVQSTSCNGNRLQSLAPLPSSPASVLPIIVWEVLFSIKLPSGSQDENRIPNGFSITSRYMKPISRPSAFLFSFYVKPQAGSASLSFSSTDVSR